MHSLNIHTPVVGYENSLDIIDRGCDIFYANSAMQYVYDDIQFFKAVDECQPHWVLIEDFLGGDFVDFFTVQNYYESKIPVKFRNKKQFIEGLSTYELVICKPYASPILGFIKKLPMENFPKDFQLEYSQTMLLRRKLNT